MTEYHLWGRVISKKNSKQLVLSRAYPLIFPSKSYMEFKKQALRELMIQRARPQIAPYKIEYSFHLKGKIDIDLDNAVTSINDILQDAGIIGDDKDVISIGATKTGGYDNFYTTIRFL